MARLDIYLHVQVWRQRHLKPDENDLLAYYISEEEVEARLGAPPGRPLWATVTLPDDFNRDIQDSLDAMQAMIATMQERSQTEGIELRLDMLVDMFGLRPFERDVLLLCLAPELDLGYLRLYTYLQEESNQRYPTVELMLNLLCADIETKMSCQSMLTAHAPLIRYQLVHATIPAGQQTAPALAHLLKLDERIRRYLLDDDTVDELLRDYLVTEDPITDGPEPNWTPGLLDHLVKLASCQQAQLFYLQGIYGVGRQKMASCLAAALGQPLLVVNCQRLQASSSEQFTQIAQRLFREARLQQAILYCRDFDTFLTEEGFGRRQQILEESRELPWITIASGQSFWQPEQRMRNLPFFAISFRMPTTAERQQIWQQQLNGIGNSLDVPAVAAQFRLSGGQIRDAVTTAHYLARLRNPTDGQLQSTDLFQASRLHSNQKLNTLAQQIRPHYRWSDIILPEMQLGQLHQLIDQVKFQGLVFESWGFARRLALGRGVHALFTGQPGTGKTMAADILAGELELDLYKIDLSAVVSKYIGETEKNLAHIFAEAETSNAVLFFDEADALFGKRTEVKDSHDRYANLEISYLLQKMDEYEGVVILATNLRENLDTAFVRRIRFIIDFPLPDSAHRLRIWQGIWPDEAPLASKVDLPLLADQLDVAGGIIRNIALSAAFLAAAEGQPGGQAPEIRMVHLYKAAEEEYRKMGRFLPHTLQAKV